MLKNIVSPYVFNLKHKLIKLLTTSNGNQLWIVGPEGRGKSTFVNGIFSDLRASKAKKFLASYFDFQSCTNNNCQVMVTKFADSLITDTSWPIPTSPNLIRNIYQDVYNKIPEMNIHNEQFFKFMVDKNPSDYELRDRLNKFLTTSRKEDDAKALGWWNCCLFILRNTPSSLGIIKNKETSLFGQCLYCLNAMGIIAERHEIEMKDSSNISMSVTGRWAIRYLFEAILSFSKLENYTWVLCLDGIEHLIKSPFLQDRGFIFLSHLIDNIQNSKTSSIFISNDSSAALTIVDEYYKDNFCKDIYHNNISMPNNTFNANDFKYYDMPELPSDLTLPIITEFISSSDNIIKVIWKNIGGNYRLLNKIISNFEDFKARVSLDTTQQILSGSTNIVDDEFFPINSSKEERLLYLNEERCKLFVKSLYDECLNEEITRFENRINRFLSLPTMEEIRLKINNKIHFSVMVLETIRHLLHKEWLQIKEDCKINNVIILALISSNILFYQLESRSLEFKNSLTKQLLQYYIDSEYESLTKIEQIEYKANFLLNQKQIYYEADRLFV